MDFATKLAACVVAAATTLLPSPRAHAIDYKNANAAECQPYAGTTLPSDLSLRAHGLKNVSADAEYVVCNITADATWTDNQPGLVDVVLHMPLAGVARCELYLGSNLTGLPVSYVGELHAGSPYLPWVESVDLGPASASAVQQPGNLPTPPVSLFCRIPPGASLVQIHVMEQAITD